MQWYWGISILIVVLIVVSLMRSGPKPTVYGSMSCGYTVKLREKIGAHDFVDCSKEKCPDFVEAYPTTKYPDGSIKVGA